MGRVEDASAHHFCATHGGVIVSFAARSAKVKDPTEMVPLLKREDANYVDILRTAAVTASAAVAAVPLALAAAPGVGGAMGAYLLGLKGAAATSAGLASLGLGSLASGGFGMFGGTAVVTTAGVAIGAKLGGGVATRYYSEVDGFAIEKIREGRDPALMCIDGFLTRDTDKASDWLNGLGSSYEGHAVYHVRWESKALHDLYSSALQSLGKQGVGWGIRHFAQSASTAAAGALAPVAAAFNLADLVGNPWWVAMLKSQLTGILIAEAIRGCENRSFILLGHSLGARAVVSALQFLATPEMSERSSRIRDVHLLGGAADLGDQAQWKNATDALEGKCYNYYTKNDGILTYLYQVANLGRSTPIGIAILPTNDHTQERLISVDCSHEVDGHSRYHGSLGRILQVEKTKPAPRGFWSWLLGRSGALFQSIMARSRTHVAGGVPPSGR
jgi:hypothetical protein